MRAARPAIERHLALGVPWVALGDWPTPIRALDIGGRPLWVKDEGASHPVYGGNKLRTLEAWFGHAQAARARRIWAIGAYGSNHVVATLVHAPAAGLDAGAIVFPQPASRWAAENCGAILAAAERGTPLIRLRSVVEVPFAAWWIARRERDAIVMPPGGATPIGTFGALSAAFELAEQIAAGAMPPPARIVVPVGSVCTTAGLLAGVALAHQLGVWRWPRPVIHGVRVTPWPVTSRLRTTDLARRTLARVHRLGGPAPRDTLLALVRGLIIDGDQLGGGYGRSTPACDAAIAELAVPGAPRLDAVYAGKAAAALLALHRAGAGPLLFWASKSRAVLPPPSPAAIDRSPPALRRWYTEAAMGANR